MSPLQIAQRGSEGHAELEEFGELHAHAVGMFTVMRDAMRDGWFDSKVPQISALANKYYKEGGMFMAPQYGHIHTWFDAFKTNLRHFDRQKIGDLTDEQIKELATSFATQEIDKIKGRDKSPATSFKAFSEITVRKGRE